MFEFPGDRRKNTVEYEVSEICLNRHVTNAGIYVLYPGDLLKRCEKCGEQTTTTCLHCGKEIRRRLGAGMIFDGPPSFCREYGEPYPWTERALAEATELVEEQQLLSDQEKQELKNTLPDLVKDTPRTQVAAMKFKRLATKAGTEALGMLRDVLVDIASETAKKIIF
jgi:hypothetical protein